MKRLNLFLSALGLLLITQVQAQTPRFAKYDVADTGAKIYMPAEPSFEKSLSEDGSEIFTSEVEFGGFHYIAIVVKLKESLGDDTKVQEGVLWSYMEYLNTNVLAMTSSVDPGYGHTLDSHPSAKGIIQYGEDAEGNQIASKGWVDANMIAFLCIYGKEEFNFNIQQMYLNGFRFPEN